MAQKVRWGVIGAGGIADRRTIPGMMLCDNAELVAVMEINMELAEKCRAKWGCKKAYDNEADLLADPEIDAVYIASPVFLHARQAMAAADAGKHILIEKPLAMTSEEGQKVVEYCKSKGVLIAAGLMMRFNTYHQQIKAAIAEGKLGQVVSCHALFSCWYPDMPGNWRQSKATAGGGAMTDMGIHCLDLIEYITGSKIIKVGGLAETMTFKYDVEDACSALFKLSCGAFGTVDANFNIPDEAVKWKLEFYGTKGSIITEGTIGQMDGGDAYAIFTGDDKGYDATQDRNETGAVKLEGELGNIYAREIESFSNSILTGAPVEVPASDAARIQNVIEKIYESQATEKFFTIA